MPRDNIEQGINQSTTLSQRLRRLIAPVTGAISALAIAATIAPGAINAQPIQEPTDPLSVPVGLIVTMKPGSIMPMSAEGSSVNPNVYSITTADISSASASLRGNPNVLSYEPMYMRQAFGNLNGALDEEWNIKLIGADIATKAGYTGKGVTVAVVDTGSGPHYDLNDNLITGGYDFYNRDNDPSDDGGHGTHVADLVATTGSEVKILAIKVLNGSGGGNDMDIGDGITYAIDHGAKIINLSLGSSRWSRYLCDPVVRANNLGIAVVVAAGNSNSSIVNYPGACDPRNFVIAATNRNDQRAPYSDYGAYIDMSAPGGDGEIGENYTRIRSAGLNEGFDFRRGTSMSAPQFAGAMAVMDAAHPELTYQQIGQILMDKSVDLGTVGRDDYYGAGRLDLANALGLPTPPVIIGPVEASPLQLPYLGATAAITATVIDAQQSAAEISVQFRLDNGTYQLMEHQSGNIWTARAVVPGNSSTTEPATHLVSIKATDSTNLMRTTDGPTLTVEKAPIIPPPPPPLPTVSLDLGPDITTCPVNGIVPFGIGFTVTNAEVNIAVSSAQTGTIFGDTFQTSGTENLQLPVEYGTEYNVNGYAGATQVETGATAQARDTKIVSVLTESQCAAGIQSVIHLPLIIR
jgi:subtilisin/minor extracellular protease Epr